MPFRSDTSLMSNGFSLFLRSLIRTSQLLLEIHLDIVPHGLINVMLKETGII